MRNLPNKKGYANHIKVIGQDLYAVEHIRGDDSNIAMVILKDGSYYIGLALLSPLDQYCRRLGHEISVGRALHTAAYDPGNYEGKLWPQGENPLVGRELGETCRKIMYTYAPWEWHRSVMY